MQIEEMNILMSYYKKYHPKIRQVSRLKGAQEPHLVPQQATVDRVTWLPTQARLGEVATVGWKTGRLGAEWEPSSVPTGWGQDGPQAAHSTHPTEGGSWGRCEQ